MVRALRNPETYVQTFKLKKMTQYLQKNLEELSQKIKNEINTHGSIINVKEDEELINP